MKIENLVERIVIGNGMIPENEHYEIVNDVVDYIANWVGSQRNDIAANGWEFEAAIREHFGVK